MIPILSTENRFTVSKADYYLTINSSSFGEFFEKYVINDCPNRAKLQFFVDPPVYYLDKPIEKVSFIKKYNHFILHKFNYNKFVYLFGISEKTFKHKEELMRPPSFRYWEHRGCDLSFLKHTLLNENCVEGHNLCSLLLSKFVTISKIKVLRDEDDWHCLYIYTSEKDPTHYERNYVMGFLSQCKMSGEEKYKINHKYVLENIYDFRKLRIQYRDREYRDQVYGFNHSCVIFNYTYPRDINIKYDNNNKLQFGRSFSQSINNNLLNIQINNIEPMTINNQYFFEFEIVSNPFEIIGIKEMSLKSTCFVWGLGSILKKGDKIGMHLDIFNGKLLFYKNEQYCCSHPIFFQKNVNFYLYFKLLYGKETENRIKLLRNFKYPTNLQYLCCVKLLEMDRATRCHGRSIGEITDLVPGLKTKLQNNFGWFL